ncbi:MAG: MarR family winged helix-turn-helix transcriptional regulator [Candidatus Poribacteria bacterium]
MEENHQHSVNDTHILKKALEADTRIMVLSHRIYSRWRKVASEYHLTPPQVNILKALHKKDNVPMSHFPRVMPCTKSNVTGVISSMEKKGLVVRSHDTEDRRVVRVKLTEKGNAIAAELPPFHQLYAGTPTSQLSPDEIEQLCNLLEKLRTLSDEEQIKKV